MINYWEQEIYFLHEHEKGIILRFGINDDEQLRTGNLFCTWKWNAITLRFGINN
jgi:hypothetical protein